MLNQINQVLASDECVLEQLLSTYDRTRTSTFAEHLRRATKRIHRNDEMMNDTLRHSEKIISIKMLTEDDERLENLKLYLERLNGTYRLIEITNYMVMDEANRKYLILESNFIKGITLENNMQHLANKTDMLRILAKVCDIAQIMHRAGMGHFDIKPNNILVTKEDAFLIDVDTLGLLKASTKTPFYSTGYTAPEIFFSMERSEKTDFFSIGAVAYEIITGFSIDSALGTPNDKINYLRCVLKKKIPSPVQFVDCGNSLSEIVMEAISPNMQDRPNAEELKKCFLEEILY